jgi:SAM-dependent methyltransferase
MNALLQRRVQRYGWDRAAAHYDSSWQRPLAPAHRALIEHAELGPGDRVLDVACGTGIVSLIAAEAVAPWGFVVGTDLSQEMVNAARARATSQRIWHTRFERADAERLDFSDAVFEAALCSMGLMYVPDPDVAVAEMTRVVVPGGRVVAAVWGARHRCGWAEIFPIVDARVKSDVCPLFFALGTSDRLASVFAHAGLVDVHTERIHTRLEWGSPEAACEAAFAGGPVALAYSRFDDETRAEACDEYLASIDRWRLGCGYAVPGEFVVVSGRKER